LDATFATAGIRIPALQRFVCHVAAELRGGRSLAAALRSAAQLFPKQALAFEIADDDATLEAGFALRDALTFPNEPIPHSLDFERNGKGLAIELNGLLARDMRAMLELCGSGRRSPEEVARSLDEPLSSLFESLLGYGILVADDPPNRAPARLRSEPGVTRLQHASLLFRGKRAGILLDPHLHSSYEPSDLADNFLRSELEGLVDAIVISHGHGDHFHVPTLMTFPADTLIVVPKVPRESMLCPDLAATLRALGFSRVVALDWFSAPLCVGDLELSALPFYGEQPLLSEVPRHPDLRNHGNTYVVRHESYTSWLLVDSGNDCTGRMTEVAWQVRARFGHIDHVLSNLREFSLHTPLYITGGHYWLSLSPDQLRRFAAMGKDVITLGPRGVAEICKIVGARRALPYAHWWSAPFDDPSERERELSAELQRELTRLGAPTTVRPWRIGDSER
jgi:L-ascorbate metabolism protein UlaG (beta-lactamase superfamily)